MAPDTTVPERRARDLSTAAANLGAETVRVDALDRLFATVTGRAWFSDTDAQELARQVAGIAMTTGARKAEVTFIPAGALDPSDPERWAVSFTFGTEGLR